MAHRPATKSIKVKVATIQVAERRTRERNFCVLERNSSTGFKLFMAAKPGVKSIENSCRSFDLNMNGVRAKKPSGWSQAKDASG